MNFTQRRPAMGAPGAGNAALGMANSDADYTAGEGGHVQHH